MVKPVIHPALASFAVPLDSLTLLEDNPRKGDVESLKALLGELGQVEPILFHERDDGVREIVHGNHRTIAARELDWEEIAALDVSGFSEAQIETLILGMNRSSDRGGYDPEALVERLSRLTETDERLSRVAGYERKDLEHLRKWSDREAPPKFDRVDLDELEGEFDHKCPRCSFEF